jgi:adenosylhomocysteine nucleosidase
MKKIGVIVAMQKELDLYIQKMDSYRVINFNHKPFYICKYNDLELIMAISGIGKVAASLTASNMIYSFSPELIINIGVSGGLDPCLNIGDWVLGLDLKYHDFFCDIELAVQNDPTDIHTYHSDLEIASKQKGCVKGLLVSGDQFITDAGELADIKAHYPEALAVDMESTAIAQTCAAYNTKFLCMRQISDIPGAENHEEQYKAFWRNAPQHSYNVFKSILDTL